MMTGRIPESSQEEASLYELYAILRSTTNAIVSVDFDGRIIRWNVGAERIFGYSAEEMIGADWRTLAPAHLHSELRKALDKIRRRRTVPEVETRRVRKDGSEFDVSFSIHPVYSSVSRELIGAITLTSDITARKAMEEALTGSASKIEAIIHTVLDGIITIDEHGTIESINPVVERMFQYRAHELIGCNVNVLMPEPYHSQHDGYLRNYLRTGEAKIIGLGREVVGKRKDGSTFPMELAVNSMEAAGRLTFVGAVKDISERKQQELLLKDTIDQLQNTLKQLKETQSHLVESEKMASLGALVAGVAHEINTPVGIGVTGASHLRGLAHDLNARYTAGTLKRSELEHFINATNEASELVLKNLDRAAKLINSFKRVAVDQSSDDDFRSFDLGEYLDEILTTFQPQLKRYRTALELECPSGIRLTTHAGALYQVMSNLITNVLIHAYDDQHKGKVHVTVRSTENSVEICVRDTGKGIRSEDFPHIFEPFYTTCRNKGGTGLGLHVTFNLVTQSLGGRIRAESAVGQGSVFVVTLPVTRNIGNP